MARRRAGLAVATLFVIAGCAAPPTPTEAVVATPRPTIEIIPATQAQLFGPWSPVPFALPPALRDTVDRACRAFIAPVPDDVRVAVMDARGLGIVQAYYWSDAGFQGQCIDVSLDPRVEFPILGGANSGGGPPWRALGPNELILDGFPVTIGDSGAHARIFGRLGQGIATVDLILTDGRTIRAATSGSFFAVWVVGLVPDGFHLLGLDRAGRKVAEITPQRLQ
jgi:hypothetical protein